MWFIRDVLEVPATAPHQPEEAEMIPALVADEIRDTLLDYLRTICITFAPGIA